MRTARNRHGGTKKTPRNHGRSKLLAYYPKRHWLFGSLRRKYILDQNCMHSADGDSHLVVVALAQTQFWQTARGQIEYNLTHLRQGVRRIIQALEA